MPGWATSGQQHRCQINTEKDAAQQLSFPIHFSHSMFVAGQEWWSVCLKHSLYRKSFVFLVAKTESKRADKVTKIIGYKPDKL